MKKSLFTFDIPCSRSQFSLFKALGNFKLNRCPYVAFCCSLPGQNGLNLRNSLFIPWKQGIPLAETGSPRLRRQPRIPANPGISGSPEESPGIPGLCARYLRAETGSPPFSAVSARYRGVGLRSLFWNLRDSLRRGLPVSSFDHP